MTLSRKQESYLGSVVVLLLGVLAIMKLGPVRALPILPSPPDIKVPIVKPDNESDIAGLDVQAPIALVYALDSKTVLYNKQADKSWPPASTTKLMSALVVKDTYTLNTLLTVDQADLTLPEKPLFLLGEELVVKDLLEAMLVTSSNQAAYILANHYPAGKEGFVLAMNNKAQELGLTQTKFADPAGFDFGNQKTTAHDLVVLGQAVMADEDLRQMVSLRQTTISDFSGEAIHSIQATNQLLGGEYEVVGIKTGTTQEAGQVLMSQFRLPAEDVVVVVMGSQDRYEDTLALIDWTIRHHHWFSMSELEAIFLNP